MTARLPIRTLIVDDELHARETVRGLLARQPSFEIVGECGSGGDARKLAVALRPDLMFLDIRMPGGNAFDLLAHLDALVMPVVIFVTAYDEYALKAFEVHALDYLLKPFDDDRFMQVVERVVDHFSRPHMDGRTDRLLAFLHGAHRQDGEVYLRRLVLREIGRVLFVSLDDVDWIEAEDYYVSLHVGSKAHLLREGLARLVERLDPRRFIQVHRSAVVSLDRVVQLRKSSLVLRNGVELPVSRARRERVAAALGARTRPRRG